MCQSLRIGKPLLDLDKGVSSFLWGFTTFEGEHPLTPPTNSGRLRVLYTLCEDYFRGLR